MTRSTIHPNRCLDCGYYASDHINGVCPLPKVPPSEPLYPPNPPVPSGTTLLLPRSVRINNDLVSFAVFIDEVQLKTMVAAAYGSLQHQGANGQYRSGPVTVSIFAIDINADPRVQS